MRKADSVAIWTYEVARRLASQHEVVVYGRCFPGQSEMEEHEGVRYRRVNVEQPFASVQKLVSRFGIKPVGRASSLYGIGYALQLGAEVVDAGYDVIHLHNLSQYAPLLRPFLPESALVLHMHCEWLSLIDRGAVRSRIGKVDRVLGCSEHICQQFEKRFPDWMEKVGVVHNGVDLAFFSQEPKRVPPPDGGTILFVGRISPEKGIHDLIAAFAKLLAVRPRAELRIVGPSEVTPLEYIVGLSDEAHVRDLARFYSGEYLAQLKASVSPDVLRRICFVGELEQSRLSEEYRRADVLVNPSLSEAFGMSLIEGMASGVPVIASWVGGMSYVVEEGKCGLLVPPAQPEALSRAIDRALGDDELRANLVSRGRRLVEERFTWSRVAQQACSQYERTLEVQ